MYKRRLSPYIAEPTLDKDRRQRSLQHECQALGRLRPEGLLFAEHIAAVIDRSTELDSAADTSLWRNAMQRTAVMTAVVVRVWVGPVSPEGGEQQIAQSRGIEAQQPR